MSFGSIQSLLTRGMRRLLPALLAFYAFFCLGLAMAANPGDIVAPAIRANSSPMFARREFYAPGHFGNAYEAMGQYEMRRYLAEVRSWGFDTYGDWFDMDDCCDPFALKYVQFGRALWEAKKQNFASAQSLGLKCELVITPNHVYVDQWRPDLYATRSDPRIQECGQLICPSKKEAHRLILQDYDHLFRDLAKAGVRLNSVAFFAYDYGGCDCKLCRPWILTFAKLSREIYKSADRVFPGIECRMIGWWWSPEEHRLFAEWADREAPGWIKSIGMYMPYNDTKIAKVQLPKGCRQHAFVHISYPDTDAPGLRYFHFGPNLAPARLEKTVVDLAAQGVTEMTSYSEGISDDVNMALLGSLSSGQSRDSSEILRAYARRYFGADQEQAAAWAQWLAAWGKPYDVDIARAAKELAVLKQHSSGSWRQRQWELKTEMFRLNGEIMKEKEWTAARLENVDQFWQVQEQIYRGLWGLPALRDGNSRLSSPFPWYSDWAKHVANQSDIVHASEIEKIR